MISLGTLDGIGCNYKSVSGVMKVSKGALTVMKGQKVAGNIYNLIGTTVVGGVASAESESDSTVLWHMRLGHMGERGMLELNKRDLLKSIKMCKLELCKFYVLEKQSKVQFKTTTNKMKEILNYVHTDL